MKIKAVIFALWHHQIKEGTENGRNWFQDPTRNIGLFALEGSIPPDGAPIDEKRTGTLWSLPLLLAKDRKAARDEILFVSDVEEYLAWAKNNQEFRTLAVTSKAKYTMGGDLSCGPNTDAIIRAIYTIEHQKEK